MGTNFATVYAAITIGYLEEKLYTEIKKVFGTDFGNYFEKSGNDFLMIVLYRGQNPFKN